MPPPGSLHTSGDGTSDVKEFDKEIKSIEKELLQKAKEIYEVSEKSKGKEKKSWPLAMAGAGAVLAHAGGIIGDFFSLGKLAVYLPTEIVAEVAGFDSPYDSWLYYPMTVGGFYVGAKLMSFTYRFSTPDSLSNIFVTRHPDKITPCPQRRRPVHSGPCSGPQGPLPIARLQAPGSSTSVPKDRAR